MSLVYVASVYSQGNANKELREKRFQFVKDWVGLHFMTYIKGYDKVLYSPIIHNHLIAEDHDLPATWDFWRGVDTVILRHCSALIVLKMDGWEKSVGITCEIDTAKMLNIPIQYIDVNEDV